MLKLARNIRRVFTHDTDREVEAIVAPVRKQINETARVAKRQRDLLKQNGVTMQIFIATGGASRK